MNLLLHELVPLRTTRSLGDFADDVALPHRYGDLTAARFKLIRLSDTEFLAADHPMPITAVFVDAQKTESWERSLQSDAAGHTWTIVTLGAPVPHDALVSATGTGKRNPDTGALLENPAEIMEDVLRLCGRSDVFLDLRAEASAESIRLAGSITKAKAISVQLDEIAYSAGAIWTTDGGRLYPATSVLGPVIDLDRNIAGGLRVSASLTDTADVLRLSYDECDATGNAQHFIELTANPPRFGGVSVELFLPWLRTPANAEALGRRTLRRMAAERYDVSVTAERRDIRPGRWVRLVDNPEWQIPGDDPVCMVLGAEFPEHTLTTILDCEAVIAAPEIEVTAHSIALPNTTEAAVEIAVKAGIATFRFNGRDGKPLFGARVSLDKGPAKTTDANGGVSFAVTPGTHTLDVEADGYTPFSQTFEL